MLKTSVIPKLSSPSSELPKIRAAFLRYCCLEIGTAQCFSLGNQKSSNANLNVGAQSGPQSDLPDLAKMLPTSPLHLKRRLWLGTGRSQRSGFSRATLTSRQ